MRTMGFSFVDYGIKKLEEQSKLFTPVEPVDALEFVTSPLYLGVDVSNYPVESLVLKLYYKLWEKYPFTPGEQKILETLRDEWDIDIDLEDLKNRKIDLLILVIGRRGTKTSVIAFIAAYEAYKLICKANPQKYYKILQKDEIFILNMASSARQARTLFSNLKNRIKNSSFFSKYIDFDKDTETELRLFTPYDIWVNQQIQERNKDKDRGQREKLRRGSIVLESIATSARGSRSRAAIVVIFDEFAHVTRAKVGRVVSDGVGSNISDKEIYRGLTPSTKTFGRDGKIIAISSPAEKAGKFYSLYVSAGGKECPKSLKRPKIPGYLLLQLSTWQANPNISREDLDADFRDDPIGASMEYGAHFADPEMSAITSTALDNFLSDERPIFVGNGSDTYVISVDPASSSDTYAIAWGHKEGDVYWIDGLKGFKPEKWIEGGERRVSLIDVETVLDEIEKLIKSLKKVAIIAYDQWNSSYCIQKLKKKRYPAIETTFTSKYKARMYGDFFQQLETGNVRLRNVPVWADVALQEIMSLQREVKGNIISYHHPTSGPVQNDDFSDVCANTVSLLVRYHSGDSELRQMMRRSGFGPIRLQSAVRPQKGKSLPGYGNSINVAPSLISGFGKERRW